MTFSGSQLAFGLLLFVTSTLAGQTGLSPISAIDEAVIGSTPIRCLCKPGVRNKSRSKGVELAYGLIGRGTYAPKGDEQLTPPYSSYSRWQNLRASIQVPVVNKPGFKLLLGYRHTQEFFAFSRFSPDYQETFQALDKNRLYSNSLSAIATRSFNDKNYMVVRLRHSSDGNYSGVKLFDSRYNSFRALVMYGIKRHQDFEWGVGVNVSTGFRRSFMALPFILYNRNFNDKWAIESTLPAYVFLRHNIKDGTIALGGVELNSQSYRLDVKSGAVPQDYAFNHNELLASLQLERRIAPWVWVNVKAGYQFNLNASFESKLPNGADFRVNPSNAPFFRMGIFLSPPSKFVK